MSEPRIRPIRWRFLVELLSADEAERVHDAVLTVLERLGLEIRSERILRDLAAVGARVDLATGRARIATTPCETPHEGRSQEVAWPWIEGTPSSLGN